MIAAPVLVGAAAAAYARYGRRSTDEAAGDDDGVFIESNEDGEAEKTEEVPRTWKESAGRADGRDGYVFGDLTRGVCVKVAHALGKADGEADVEAEGDAQHTQVQRLVREAIKLYRARGYTGTINMSHTVAYFNESVSVSVRPSEGDGAPWEAHGADAASTEKIVSEGRAGLVFATLLSRLERRARSWQAFSGDEGLDPNLTQSAQIGFAIPVVKLGWGVSVSLTVSASTLLRWADHAAELEKQPVAPEEPELPAVD